MSNKNHIFWPFSFFTYSLFSLFRRIQVKTSSLKLFVFANFKLSGIWVWRAFRFVFQSLLKVWRCVLNSSAFLTCFFHFILRFWYHVFTCICDRPRDSASSSLSGVDKYFWSSNLFSSPMSCSSVKTVRLLRHFLGFRKLSEQDGDLVRM